MSGETLRQKVVIINPQGFHMRPLTAFVELARKFQSAVTVARGDYRCNGKSPLELMTLGAEEGTELVLEITGSDAAAAMEALVKVITAPGPPEEAPESPLPQKG